MEQVVVLQDADRAGPLQRRQGGLERTAQRVVERQQPGSLARPEKEVGKPFSPVGKGANRQCLGRGHAWNI